MFIAIEKERKKIIMYVRSLSNIITFMTKEQKEGKKCKTTSKEKCVSSAGECKTSLRISM